jgi:glycosyltransferase involved in cell wall biosynthesis
MKMSMGLPVVACPVPSYRDVIVQGENGFLATSRDEWLRCFEELRDPRRREAIGRKARASVLPRYSKAEQARRLIAALERVVGAPSHCSA